MVLSQIGLNISSVLLLSLLSHVSARARTKSAEQEQLCQRTKERIDVTQIECLKLEEKIRTMVWVCAAESSLFVNMTGQTSIVVCAAESSLFVNMTGETSIVVCVFITLPLTILCK